MIAARTRPRRRAFALPMALVILLSASLVVTAALQRQGAQMRSVQRQLNEYKKRHDAHGVRAIVMHWIKELTPNDLETQARNPSLSHVFDLPSGARAIVRVTDGQGLPIRNTSEVDTGLQARYEAMLGRLADRPDLTRGSGPWQISVGGAPREVLEAMSGENGPEFADEVLRLRRRGGEVDRSAFSQMVSTIQMDGEDRQFITRTASFGSSLYRVTVETEDWAGRRRYEMLVEHSPTGTVLHEWFEYAESDLNALREGAGRRDG